MAFIDIYNIISNIVIPNVYEGLRLSVVGVCAQRAGRFLCVLVRMPRSGWRSWRVGKLSKRKPRVTLPKIERGSLLRCSNGKVVSFHPCAPRLNLRYSFECVNVSVQAVLSLLATVSAFEHTLMKYPLPLGPADRHGRRLGWWCNPRSPSLRRLRVATVCEKDGNSRKDHNAVKRGITGGCWWLCLGSSPQPVGLSRYAHFGESCQGVKASQYGEGGISYFSTVRFPQPSLGIWSFTREIYTRARVYGNY